MKSREAELRAILNEEDFGSDEWNAASEELHTLRANAADQVQVDDDWCTTDGQWWI